MKKFDIDVRFTEKVSEYLMKGYVIHADSMGGHQGEVAKIDLVKDNTLIRIYLDDESNYFFDDDNTKWSGRSRVLRVGKWINPASHASDCWDTVWMNHLEILEEIKYYQLDDRSRTPWYVEDLNEALACQELHWKRVREHYKKNPKETEYYNDEAHKDVAVDYLKRKLDYKRVSREYVSIRKREGHKFYVDYRGDQYLLK